MQRDAYLNDIVQGLSVARVRLAAAKQRVANGVKDAQGLLAVHVFAADMAWFSKGAAAPARPTGVVRFGIAPALIITFGAGRFRAIP
jgi:hypothetical protein